jgi:hypothetical protein
VDLLALDEIRRRLRIVGQSYLGVTEIPVAQIIGSVDRNADFDRSFRPRRRLSRGRLASLRSAFPDGNMPPIEVQELGGSYFVADGHHRACRPTTRSAPTSTSASSCTPSSSACSSRRAGWAAPVQTR